MISKVLQRLFPRKEVKSALAALRELRPLFETAFWPRIAIDEISRRTKEYLVENPKDVEREIANGKTPRVVCLMAMVQLTRLDLIRGREHIGHGRLTMAGDGKKGIFDIAMKELEKSGICTAEVRQLRTRELEQDMREVW
jgi:hypothetical protein